MSCSGLSTERNAMRSRLIVLADLLHFRCSARHLSMTQGVMSLIGRTSDE
jgi:hypothetical protein